MQAPRTNRLLTAALLAVPAVGSTGHAHGQILINEANAVGVNGQFIDTDLSKPYEGYDYGVLTHSGNNNSPTAGTDPGNPFPADVDTGTGGNQTTLPNGWAGTTGWARIQGNGGDWIEFVVTEDNLDLRGWTLYWENDDADSNGDEYPAIAIRDGIVGETATERGQIKFTQNAAWSNLRAGTIITISEDASLNEVRDGYPNLPPSTPTTPLGLHDTGHDYDLSTDLSFDPIGSGTASAPGADADWHIHFHLDESVTDAGGATDYFEAYSNIKVDNDDWRAVFFDETNTTIALDADDDTKDRSELDLTTGLVGQFIGESAASWGTSTGAGGVNGNEIIAFTGDPTTDGTSSNANYEDIDFSTFGTENMYNALTEDTLDGVQDLSAIRSWLSSILPGDANLDGTVSLADLDILGQNFGGPGGWGDGDFNADGNVTLADLDILGQNFGSSSTALSQDEALAYIGQVPEPTSLAMLGIAGLTLIRRRRG